MITQICPTQENKTVAPQSMGSPFRQHTGIRLVTDTTILEKNLVYVLLQSPDSLNSPSLKPKGKAEEIKRKLLTNLRDYSGD